MEYTIRSQSNVTRDIGGTPSGFVNYKKKKNLKIYKILIKFSAITSLAHF